MACDRYMEQPHVKRHSLQFHSNFAHCAFDSFREKNFRVLGSIWVILEINADPLRSQNDTYRGVRVKIWPEHAQRLVELVLKSKYCILNYS